MNALLFSAGLGTRLRPITDTLPKALVEVGGRTLLEINLEKLRREGFDMVVINVHHFADKIRAYLAAHDNFGMDIRISDESEKLLDTGGAVKKACSLFKGRPFLIHNVDILSDARLGELYEHHLKSGNAATLLVSGRNSSRKLLFGPDDRLCGWHNLKTGELKLPLTDKTTDETSEFAFSGIHVFSPELAEKMAGYPDKFPIIDFYLSACRSERIAAYRDDGLRLADVGKIEELQAAEGFLRSLEKARG